MKQGIYAGMMVVLAIMIVFAFAAGPVMAASQDENTRAMGSNSTQGNVTNKTNTGIPSQEQTGISGNMKSGVTAQNETNNSRHSRTDVSQQTGNQLQANPGMAERNPNVAAERNPNMAAERNPNMAAQVNPNVQANPGVAAQPRAAVQQPAAVAGQNQGTEALVARVDRPDNCLRLRSAPSRSGNVIGCAKMGDKLFLTGVFSGDGRWAQLNNNSWVYYDQIKTSLKPKKQMRAASRPRSSEEFDTWEYPAGSYYSADPYYDSGYGYYDYWPGYYGGYRGFHRGLGLYGGFGPFGHGPGIGLGFRFH